MARTINAIIPQPMQGVAFLEDVTRFSRATDERGPLSFGVPESTIRTSSGVINLDRMIRVDPTSGPLAFSIPSLSGADIGRIIGIINVSTSIENVTITPAGATIDGSASATLSKSRFAKLYVVTSSTTIQAVV